MTRAMLTVSNLTVRYGPIRALSQVSLVVPDGALVLIAGANGAGKTTLLRAISGLVTREAGEVLIDGRPLAGLAAHQIARLGIRHVPEGRHVWPGLTVEEHLQIAWSDIAKSRRSTIKERVAALFPRLIERWRQPAGRMSGGEQQMLAIAVGLAAEPRLLMIDELSLGLAPAVVTQLFAALQQVNREGLTLVLVEQALKQALQIAERGYVLEAGKLVVQGTARELEENEAVRKAYLTM